MGASAGVGQGPKRPPLQGLLSTSLPSIGLCVLRHMGGGGSAGVAPAMVWAGAWLGPTLPTLVPPFGRGGRKRAQVFRRRKPVVFGCRAAWVMDVAPVSVHAREVLTPSAVALCRSVTLPDGWPKPLCVCHACSVRASTSCLRVLCGCSKCFPQAGRGTSSMQAKAKRASAARA